MKEENDRFGHFFSLVHILVRFPPGSTAPTQHSFAASKRRIKM